MQAAADGQKSPHARMTLLASLKDSLKNCNLEAEQKKPEAKQWMSGEAEEKAEHSSCAWNQAPKDR